MTADRGKFGSRFGFIMAAAGSAVGLGNIWGFPTQAASNGGGAFLLVYLVLAFVLAYPALMAELIIGRHAHANAVQALRLIAPGRKSRAIGTATGLLGLLTASLILGFYAIVAGWMIAHFGSALMQLLGLPQAAQWLVDFGLLRNVVFTVLFMSFTIGIIARGVHDGIERWSSRLMPVLLITLLLLIAHVMTLAGALTGLKAYLLPDFSAIHPQLIVAALGQAFFSLSLGVGTMLIYASYLNDDENLPMLGGMVAVADIAIAVIAGFLVLPAMYVALHNGVNIFTDSGSLISEDTLIFTVLPALFETMGGTGLVISLIFFALMTIAALTSSISMLEVPVAYAIENHGASRPLAASLTGITITLVSCLILLNFDSLFGLVISLTTRYSQPLLGFMYCLFCGWLWQRNSILQELRKGADRVEQSLFWRVWPWYIRFVCPLVILIIFAQSLRT